MLTHIMSFMGSFVLTVIEQLGYLGIFFLMALESTFIPLPSELVMPFAGFLAAQGTFSFLFVILASSLGSVAGSLFSYWLGRSGGIRFLRRYGKYFLVDEQDLERTQLWFKRRGGITVFFSRFIPVVRHFISLPAGMGKMDLKRFVLYTFVGATIWNTFLAALGYYLGVHWELVRQYTEPLSILVAVLLVCGVVFVILHHIKRKRNL